MIVIGAIDNTYDYGNETSGYVRVFRNVNESWIQVGSDIVGEGQGDRFGYSVSTNYDGTIIGVGGVFNSNFHGHVRVLKLENDTSWVQLGSDLDGSVPFGFFGKSIAMDHSGYRMVVGANGVDNGYVKVFEFSSMVSTWIQIGSTLTGLNIDDRFGHAVDMNNDGTIICASSIGHDGVTNNAGHVRAFEFTLKDWRPLGTDMIGTEHDDNLGYSLSMNGDGHLIVVGMPNASDKRGRVRVYHLVDSKWVQNGRDLIGEIRGDKFGYDVDVDQSGTYLVVGSIGVDVSKY
ncbi:hypothetical protein N9C24_04875 [Gammaproteobacteria bacterium]|nr:hypothetical protein [Gammaproteobacteria bacterium]